jgi:hypothetical protein
LSTRCSLKHERDEATGQEVHLYRDLLDEDHCVMLELEGFTFEAATWVAPSGSHKTRVQLRIPDRWARKLGLVEPATPVGPE